jgi:hypothetical protein
LETGVGRWVVLFANDLGRGGAGPRGRPTEGWLKRGDGEFQTGCARKYGIGHAGDR